MWWKYKFNLKQIHPIDKQFQYDINRKAVKVSGLSLGKAVNFEHLTCGEILISNQKQIIEPAKITYSSLGKGFEK